MTSPFRELSVVVPLFPPPEQREKGEAKVCPACGGELTETVYGHVQVGERVVRKKIGWNFSSHPECRGIFCGPGQRVSTGWWRRCKEPGAHLHQKCWSCGAKWIRDCVGVV